MTQEYFTTVELIITGISGVLVALASGLVAVRQAWKRVLKPRLDQLQEDSSRVRFQTENDHPPGRAMRDDLDALSDQLTDMSEKLDGLSTGQHEQSLVLTKLEAQVSKGKDSDLEQWQRLAHQSTDLTGLRNRIEKLERET